MQPSHAAPVHIPVTQSVGSAVAIDVHDGWSCELTFVAPVVKTKVVNAATLSQIQVIQPVSQPASSLVFHSPFRPHRPASSLFNQAVLLQI